MNLKAISLAIGLSATVVLTAQAETASEYKTVLTPAQPTTVSSSLSGTLTITSNYMFRGLSISNNLPAFQGGLTYSFPSTGVHFNVWGSNVNFADPQGNTATVEIDTVMGIANPIGEHFSYDVSVARYFYPKSAASYSELLGNAQWYFLTTQISYSTNVNGYHATGTYFNLGFKYDIPSRYLYNIENVNLSGGVGHYSLPRNAGLSSYNDYNLGISKGISNYVLALLLSDTGGSSFNLANDPTAANHGFHLTASVTANF